MRPPRPLVIAHRGASGQLAENTLPAYELAIEQRADMIEIDLHRTRDGATVIAHDEELSGLGGKGEIAAATLAEVRALDAGGGERVPTLDEVLDRFGERIPFNLELKRGSSAGASSKRCILPSSTRCWSACGHWPLRRGLPGSSPPAIPSGPWSAPARWGQRRSTRGSGCCSPN